MERGNHRHVGRIPPDSAPGALVVGETDLEALDELTVEGKLNGAGTRG